MCFASLQGTGMMEHLRAVILVVDDNDDIRRLTTLQLQSAGFEVKGAASGSEALDRAEERPDLILLLSLPLRRSAVRRRMSWRVQVAGRCQEETTQFPRFGAGASLSSASTS